MQEACCSPEVETTESTGLAGRGIDTLSVEELEEEIAELCAHIDAATYRLLRAIGEVDRREAWPVGFLSMAHWLSWRVGIDLRTAREKVRVARALEDLPLISDAFRQGKMSYSKVRAMCRIATPDNEEYLLYIAENGTTEDVERVVRGYRRASTEWWSSEAGCPGKWPRCSRKRCRLLWIRSVHLPVLSGTRGILNSVGMVNPVTVQLNRPLPASRSLKLLSIGPETLSSLRKRGSLSTASLLNPLAVQLNRGSERTSPSVESTPWGWSPRRPWARD